MGREFPYTPEGMAAAEDYRSSMGMRGGGMLGFRPVGYQDGDLVDEELNTVEQLRNRFYELRKLISDGASGAEEELLKLIKREEAGLRASKDPKMNQIIDNYIGDISISPGPLGPPDLQQYQVRKMLQGAGDQRLSDRDVRAMQDFAPQEPPDQISTTDPYWGFGYQEEYDPYGQETADTQWVEGSTGRHQGQPYNRKARGGLMSLARRRGYAG
jgi:hypothetical protein|tara:strand:- start:2671 stop:3312 length:642 start_codon:yes stop_codon:yes gene_type:complete